MEKKIVADKLPALYAVVCFELRKALNGVNGANGGKYW